jgi:phage tail-like protein
MSIRSLIAAVTGVVLGMFITGADVLAQDGRVLTTAQNRSATFALVVEGKEFGVFTQLMSEADFGTSSNRTVTLAGGRTQSGELAAWHELVILGDIAAARRSASIVLYDPKGNPVSTYNFTNAWPTKVSFDGGTRGHIAAKVMLVYESMRVSVD